MKIIADDGTREGRIAKRICVDCGNRRARSSSTRCYVCAKLVRGFVPKDWKAAPSMSKADQKLAVLGRCKCGLLLPCARCLPTIQEMAGGQP